MLMAAMTSGNDFFGFDPPILPGLIDPVSRHLKAAINNDLKKAKNCLTLIKSSTRIHAILEDLSRCDMV